MTESDLNSIKKLHRLTNYLSVAMLYLKDNFLLERELEEDDIKDRILGHWGTVPGVNLVYAGLHYIAKRYEQETLFVLGPGHGAPAVLANQYVTGVLEEYYPKYSHTKEGLHRFLKEFSWPGGMPSHTFPGVPGNIHEGGELGYSLGTAFGAVFDNPDLLSVALVGDGELETGPLSASWQSNKFINPRTDGAVLPIIHLNGYRISGPSLLGTMSDEEIIFYFKGLGYKPYLVDQFASDDFYKEFMDVLETAYTGIIDLKDQWQETSCPMWPLIVLRSKKGWTCPEFCKEESLEDHNNSHGIPVENPKEDKDEFEVLKTWLSSYVPSELFDSEGLIKDRDQYVLPEGDLRIGNNQHAFGMNEEQQLILPDLENFEAPMFERGATSASSMTEFGEYLRDICFLNEKKKNFRIFSPDESDSNKLSAVFEATTKRYIWPVRQKDDHFSVDGRVMEILSEHVLQEWYEGYLKTGRSGVLVSYEAFLGIISTQVDQFIKYLKQSEPISWRKPIPAMNLVASSTLWRQDHNGFSHQNPIMINNLLLKQADYVSVYTPADSNLFLASMQDGFKETNKVNLYISGKRGLPQWLDLEEAKEHVAKGIGEWDWAGNYEQNTEVDIVLMSAGDYQTVETLASAQILKKEIPELRFKYINVNEVSRLGIGDQSHPYFDATEFAELFGTTPYIIFNFHGYPETIKQITYGSGLEKRMTILGYKERGTTTTPFDMQVVNETSRYHVALQALMWASQINPKVLTQSERLRNKWENILSYHYEYIRKHGVDIPEVRGFRFEF